MKLISASVQGLFGSYNHTIDINSEGITFIHSPNGVGKTVFMTLIYNMVRCDVESLSQFSFEKATLAFDDGSEIVATKESDRVRMALNKNGVFENITSASSVGLSSPTYITSSRLTTRRSDGSLVYSLDLYIDELKSWFQTAKDDSAIYVDGVECEEDLTDYDIEYRLKNLKAKVDFMFDSGFRVNLPLGYKLSPSRYDISKNHTGYLKLVNVLESYLEKDYQLAESIIAYQDIVNSFFTNKRLQISAGRMMVILKDGSTIPMESLSSGEKHLLIILYRLLFQAKPGSLAIIDEPEISLHVSWQQKLGDVLSEICRIRDIQIIIATHSPQIIHERWDDATELR